GDDHEERFVRIHLSVQLFRWDVCAARAGRRVVRRSRATAEVRDLDGVGEARIRRRDVSGRGVLLDQDGAIVDLKSRALVLAAFASFSVPALGWVGSRL